MSAVPANVSASVARSGISQGVVSVAFGTASPISHTVTYLALSESSLSAILILSHTTALHLAVSIAGDSWLGSTASFAPVHQVSVSASISASVGTSSLPATVSLALGVVHDANCVHAHPMY